MAKHYSHMTPGEQRAVDERDLTILQMLDAGRTYAEIGSALNVSPPTIAKMRKLLDEESYL